jgi:hypothetical protein
MDNELRRALVSTIKQMAIQKAVLRTVSTELLQTPRQAAGTSIPWNNIPANPACNSIYLQLLHLDTGAIYDLAMSPGLKLDAGN